MQRICKDVTPTPVAIVLRSISHFSIHSNTMNDPFRSERLLYRAVEDTEEDTALFHSILSDAQAYANSCPFLLKPQSATLSAYFKSRVVENALLGVVICLPGCASSASSASSESPIPIGCISLSSPAAGREHHRNSSISIDIIASCQRQGYGSEAIEWVLNWGFRVAGLHRIEIDAFSWNEGAMRLYERLGFVLEGRARESLWYQGGWHDNLSFSMLEGEWESRRGTGVHSENASTHSAENPPQPFPTKLVMQRLTTNPGP